MARVKLAQARTADLSLLAPALDAGYTVQRAQATACGGLLTITIAGLAGSSQAVSIFSLPTGFRPSRLWRGTSQLGRLISVTTTGVYAGNGPKEEDYYTIPVPLE